MDVTRPEIAFAIKDYARSCRTVEDLCLFCDTSPDFAVLHAQVELFSACDREPASFGSIGWRLAEFLWRMSGPSKCLRVHFSGRYESLREFLEHKVHAEFSRFTGKDIQLLQSKCPWMEAEIENGLRFRVNEKTAYLRSQGAEPIKDIVEVKRRIGQYRFNPELNELLDKVEAELMNPGDAFDQAAALKHIRTFYEKLHEHVGEELRKRKPETVDGTDLTKCGQALDFLCRKNLLTDKMFALGKGLFGVLSEEGVHAIKADREYVRLCRNMVAEYALVLFFELGRRIA